MYIDKIPDDAVLIENSRDYVDPRGNVYGIENRPGKNFGRPFIKTLQSVYGYKYTGINYLNGKRITKRVHRLVANAFIPNPDNLPLVMHKDNDKTNNCVDNLKWGSISENTQQAVNDGLLINKKGFDDSQSINCDCYSTLTNELIGEYGSISEAERETGVSKGGIVHQLNYPDKPIKKDLYFVKSGDGPRTHKIVIACDSKTDKEVARFSNIGKASKSTGISDSTISAQVKSDKKPKWIKDDVYFKYLEI